MSAWVNGVLLLAVDSLILTDYTIVNLLLEHEWEWKKLTKEFTKMYVHGITLFKPDFH